MAEGTDSGLFTRWRALPGDERRDLFASAWRLAAVHAALRLGGLRRSQRLLGRRASHSSTADTGLDAWRRRSLAIRRVGARLPGAHCLSRALCLWCWMRRAGLAPELRIGIRPSPQGRILSHAWVELDGEPVDETRDGIADCRIVDWPEQPFEP